MLINSNKTYAMKNRKKLRIVKDLLVQMAIFMVLYFCVGLLYGWIFSEPVDYGELIGSSVFLSVVISPILLCRKYRIGIFK